MSIIKRITYKTVTLAVVIALTIASMFGALAFVFTARAAEDKVDDTEEFRPVDLNISNKNFSDTTGSAPASPSSWTANTNGTYCGVIDLTPSVYNADNGGNKKFKLDGYKEYSTPSVTPKTIFGADSDHEGTDKKTLLINSPFDKATFTYTSSSMSFAPNSFYRVSAWVKTGSFGSGMGATVKLEGLGADCAFRNINTVKDIEADGDGVPVLTVDNDYGWKQYTIYVRTSASITSSVTLTLGIGDELKNNDDDPTDEMPGPAKGYAMFDTVKAEQISSKSYAEETQYFTATSRDNVTVNADGTCKAFDLYDADILTAFNGTDYVDIGTFSHTTTGDPERKTDWNFNATYDEENEEPEYGGAASVNVYNAGQLIDVSLLDDKDSNYFGFSKNPWSPLGQAEVEPGNTPAFLCGTNNNILIISSATDAPASAGVASPDFTIERYHYYRLGVWVKGDNIKEGNGISLGIKGDTYINSKKLAQWYTGLAGDSNASAQYGWKEQVVYIKGSMLKDVTVHFELWLGSPTSKSTGIAMFDNITFTELSYTEYTKRSSADSGNILELDQSPAATGVTNGNFMSIGDYDDFKYPLPAASWNYFTASSIVSSGFSKHEVNTDSVVNGIIPVDDATFDSIKSEGIIPTVRNPKEFAGAPDYNALILSSTEKTAVCYQSPSVTASVDKAYKITVDMAVDGVTGDSYGASLVLKASANKVVSTIEGIKSTDGAFHTYTFYIDTPLTEQSMYVEIWLGLNDRKNNMLKTSDGNIYVKSVGFEEWTASGDKTIEAEYKAKLEDYVDAMSDRNRLKNLDYGMYSFSNPALNYFDAYTYNIQDGLATPYGWSFTSSNSANALHGLYDVDNVRNNELYPGFEAKGLTGNMLFLYNTIANRSTYTYDNTLSLVANTYYRLDVTLKLKLSEADRTGGEAIGANINLTGTVESSFENIKDTTTLVSEANPDSRDYETFKTYSFYINTGANGGEVGLNITLGGNTAKTHIQGILVIGDITLKSINNAEYDSVKDKLDETCQKTVELTTETEEETTEEGTETDEEVTDDDEATPGSIAWWVLPTVIFSACMIAAIIIILIVRLRERAKKNKKTTYASEYDRNAALKNIEKLSAAEAAERTGRTQRDEDDLDDDITTVAPEQIEDVPEEEPAEEPEAPAEPAPQKPVHEDLDD